MTSLATASSQAPAAFDVLVLGFGAAGAAAAIAAHDAGARVLLAEKMPYPGGLSLASAGGVRIAYDADAATRYLCATCGGRTPDALLQVLAQDMVALPLWLRTLADEVGATVRVTPALGNYPFPGFDQLGYAEVAALGQPYEPASARPLYSDIGANLFGLLWQAVQRRPGITVWLESPARRLLRQRDGAVCGAVLQRDGRELEVHARAGVVLATGGFEADAQMQSDFFEAGAALPGSFLGNTGDGIRMSQQVGSGLWHMWHHHGPYGLRHPDPAFPYALYLKTLPMWTPGHRPAALPVMPWIVLDQTGRRFANEYEPYPGDTGVRHFAHFDAARGRHTRLPAWLLLDQDGFERHPLGRLVANDPKVAFRWSADNRQELALGILQAHDSLDAAAAFIGAEPGVLQRQVRQWNGDLRRGRDRAFGRRPETMAPIARAPFYTAQVWPLLINTQGGPRHDVHQRVLDVHGEPIEGLYAAGELGSVFGHVYMAGGNLAECLAGGRRAARHAVARPGQRPAHPGASARTAASPESQPLEHDHETF